MKTICVNCKHCIGDEPWGARREWYDFKCSAFPTSSPYNYVEGFQPAPELPYCRDINKAGECPGYEPGGLSLRQLLRSMFGAKVAP